MLSCVCVVLLLLFFCSVCFVSVFSLSLFAITSLIITRRDIPFPQWRRICYGRDVSSPACSSHLRPRKGGKVPSLSRKRAFLLLVLVSHTTHTPNTTHPHHRSESPLLFPCCSPLPSLRRLLVQCHDGQDQSPVSRRGWLCGRGRPYLYPRDRSRSGVKGWSRHPLSPEGCERRVQEGLGNENGE